MRQQYERQWRMACDPLREQESKAILRATNAARAYQIGEKMAMLEAEEQVTPAPAFRPHRPPWHVSLLARRAPSRRGWLRVCAGRCECAWAIPPPRHCVQPPPNMNRVHVLPRSVSLLIARVRHRPQETRLFDELWDQDRKAKLGREEREEEARRAMDADHKFVLDQQVSELHSYRAAERELSAEEANVMREQWDLERAEAAKVEALRREVMDAAQLELHAFNKLKRDQLASSVAEERDADLARLQAQLDMEKADEEREAAAREAMAKETRLFAEHMLAQKRALASREAEIDAAQKLELDKAWDKRLAVWGQEQEAREHLMAQVLNERKMQIQKKVEMEKVDKAKQAAARIRLEAELARVNEMEANKLEQGRQVRMEHRALLENQMKQKAFSKAAAQFNKSQERMAAERSEAAYQAMLADQMAKTTANMEKFSAN